MGQLLFYDFQESAQDYVPPLIVQAILLSPVIHHSCTLIMPRWAEAYGSHPCVYVSRACFSATAKR